MRAYSRLLLFACVAAATLRPGALHAQENGLDRARELYEQGASAYQAGDFDAAIAAFERAYAISGRAALLFNIAQAERLAGPTHCERALLAYQRYLRAEPDSSNAAEVQQRISEMQSCSDAQRSAATPNRPQAAEPSEPVRVARREQPTPAKTASKLGPLLVLGAGAVLAGSGAVIYGLAREKFDDVRSSCPCKEGEFAGWERASHVSYGLLALGGAAITAGAAWWFVDTRQQRSAGYALGVAHGQLFLSGRF